MASTMALTQPSRDRFQRLQRTLIVAAACICTVAHATPEEDRTQLVQLYQSKFPGIPLDAYVDGAMVFSPDAKAQFERIMEFPPFQPDVDAGRQLWERQFSNGKTFADCFPNGGHNVAGNYPQFDVARDTLVTFEMAINQCRRDNGEAPWKIGDKATMGVLTAYARTLSDGMRVHIRVDSPRALGRYEAGKKLYFSRMGQLNFACASCHLENAGKILRTEILSPTVGQATHWPAFRGGDNLTTLQARYKRCMEQVRAEPFTLGSDEFNNLEYFHSYLSNGLPLRSAVYRK